MRCVLLFGDGILDPTAERSAAASHDAVDEIARCGVSGLLVTTLGESFVSTGRCGDGSCHGGGGRFLDDLEHGLTHLAPGLSVRRLACTASGGCNAAREHWEFMALEALIAEIEAFAAPGPRGSGGAVLPDLLVVRCTDRATLASCAARLHPAMRAPVPLGPETDGAVFPVVVASARCDRRGGSGGRDGSDGQGSAGCGLGSGGDGGARRLDFPQFAEDTGPRSRPLGCPWPRQSWTLAGESSPSENQPLNLGSTDTVVAVTRAKAGLARCDTANMFGLREAAERGAEGTSHARFLAREIGFWCGKVPKYGA
jgi:hypothetical protein